MSRILVVEDDERIRSSMRLALEDEGYTVEDVGSGEEALGPLRRGALRAGAHRPDAARHRRLRDLPDAPPHSTVPVIMVTARSDTHDVVAGLEAGADDYVTKPFVAKELAARIRALLRRSRPGRRRRLGRSASGTSRSSPTPAWCAGAARRSTAPGPSSGCLCELADHPGKVLSREHLLEQVWGYDYFGDGRLVDVHVRRLRTKVEPDPANPRYILTVRGMGYKLAV